MFSTHDIIRYYPSPEVVAKLSPKEKRFIDSTDCTQSKPCGRVPCVACGIAAQRWFINAAARVFSKKQPSKLDAVTIICAELIFDDLMGEDVSIASCAKHFDKLIRQALPDNRLWFGALDISFNVDRRGQTRRTWCLHAMFITPKLENAERTALRSQLKSNREVPRPLYRSSLYNLDGLSDYIFKAKFRQREVYLNRNLRRCTSDRRLQGAPQTALFEHFGNTLHSERVIAIGCRCKLAG